MTDEDDSRRATASPGKSAAESRRVLYLTHRYVWLALPKT
jgi:hypothetical protein